MKLFRSLLVTFPALLIATLAGAQTGYPDKPVRIFVGFTPGERDRHHRARVRAEAQ